MKTKHVLAMTSLLLLITNGAIASLVGENSPGVSPAFPGKVSVSTTRNYSPLKDETPWEFNLDRPGTIPMPKDIKKTKKLVTLEEVDASPSTQTVFQARTGEIIYFTQFKNAEGRYSVIIPQKIYDKMLDEGYNFDETDVKSVSDEEYKNMIKDVQLVIYVKESHLINKYIGGEGGRCAAGTIGGAIGGALGGAAVGGPAGAVAGAIGGALAGSAASCK